MYNIEFYEDKNGNSEIADYIKELNAKAATSKECRINFNKIEAYMDMLEELGIIEQAKRNLKDYLERNE